MRPSIVVCTVLTVSLRMIIDSNVVAAHPVPCRMFRNCSLNIISDNDWKPILAEAQSKWMTTSVLPANTRPNARRAATNELHLGRRLPALPNHYTNLHRDSRTWDRRDVQYAEPVPGEVLYPPKVMLIKPRRSRKVSRSVMKIPRRYYPVFRPTLVPLGHATAVSQRSPTIYPFYEHEAIKSRPNLYQTIHRKKCAETTTGNPLFGFEPSLFTIPVRVNYRSSNNSSKEINESDENKIYYANHRHDDPAGADQTDNILIPITTTLRVHHAALTAANNSTVSSGTLANSQQQLFVVTPRPRKRSINARVGGFRAGNMRRRRQPKRTRRTDEVYTLNRLLQRSRQQRTARRIAGDVETDRKAAETRANPIKGFKRSNEPRDVLMIPR